MGPITAPSEPSSGGLDDLGFESQSSVPLHSKDDEVVIPVPPADEDDFDFDLDAPAPSVPPELEVVAEMPEFEVVADPDELDLDLRRIPMRITQPARASTKILPSRSARATAG